MNRICQSRVGISALRIAFFSVVACGFGEQTHAAEFVPLGFLPNGNFASFAMAVSNGGTLTVVGYANTQTQSREAFIWTPTGGMVGLGVDWATSVSANGQVVVGGDELGSGWRWTAATGAVSIGPGQATGVSADGSVISGDNNSVGYRWTAATGQVNLPIPPGAIDDYNPALGISANGQYIVGQAATPISGSYRAYRYDTTNGYVMQQAGSGLYTTDGGLAVTPDGTTVVGDATVNGNGVMAVWVNGTLTNTADSVGSYSHLIGEAVSANGQIVVGSSEQEYGSAFIWDATDGAQLLQTVLTDKYGLNLTGWQLADATGISADGTVITGWGLDPQGYNEAFVAEIPEPGSLAILALGSGLLLRRRKRVPASH